jgi:hypothetical protein
MILFGERRVDVGRSEQLSFAVNTRTMPFLVVSLSVAGLDGV